MILPNTMLLNPEVKVWKTPPIVNIVAPANNVNLLPKMSPTLPARIEVTEENGIFQRERGGDISCFVQVFEKGDIGKGRTESTNLCIKRRKEVSQMNLLSLISFSARAPSLGESGALHETDYATNPRLRP